MKKKKRKRKTKTEEKNREKEKEVSRRSTHPDDSKQIIFFGKNVTRNREAIQALKFRF